MQAAVYSLSPFETLSMTAEQSVSEADQVAIRAACNRWSGPLSRIDAEGRRAELEEREEIVAAVIRLYALSRSRLARSKTRPVQGADVERVLSCFRRLAVMARVKPAEIGDYCERAAADDDNEIAHRADPLLLRYVLTYHDAATEGWFAKRDIERLRYVCERADLAGIRAWFEKVASNKEALPRDSAQFLRLFLLRMWNRRMGDLETLAFEQAVLEVRLFEAMGWENTRMFCALLRRISGGNLPAFGAYLNSEDIEEGLALHGALGNEEQCAHFRALATVHDSKLVGELEKAVFANAAHFDAQAEAAQEAAKPQMPAVVEPAAKPARMSRLRRLFGMRGEAA